MIRDAVLDVTERIARLPRGFLWIVALVCHGLVDGGQAGDPVRLAVGFLCFGVDYGTWQWIVGIDRRAAGWLGKLVPGTWPAKPENRGNVIRTVYPVPTGAGTLPSARSAGSQPGSRVSADIRRDGGRGLTVDPVPSHRHTR